jgi:hypothetical protein
MAMHSASPHARCSKTSAAPSQQRSPAKRASEPRRASLAHANIANRGSPSIRSSNCEYLDNLTTPTSFCSAKPSRWLPATSPQSSTPPSRTLRCSSLLSAISAQRTSRCTWSHTCGRPGPMVSTLSTLARPGRRLSLPHVSSSPLTTQPTVCFDEQFDILRVECAKIIPQQFVADQGAQFASSLPVPTASVPSSSSPRTLVPSPLLDVSPPVTSPTTSPARSRSLA